MIDQPKMVDIAMATFNGAKYLPELLESLAKQTYPAIKICVSDDGSSDDTLKIIAEWQDRLTIRLAPTDPQQNITRNFENALRSTDALYIALSDQDDVWDPRKIALLLERVEAIEARHASSVPALAFCDLTVVDEDLRVIDASFFCSSVKSRQAARFRDFVINNHAPGCSMLMNRALLDLALPFPAVDIHDHWLIQVASIFGYVGHVDIPLLKYRQHSSNSIGLGYVGTGKWGKVRRMLLELPSELAKRRQNWKIQAGAVSNNMTELQACFGDRLPSDAREIINAIVHRDSARHIGRLLRGARHGDRWLDYRGVLHALAGYR